MAFPVIASVNPAADNATGGAATSGDVAATSHAVALTSSAGALLMMYGRVAAAGAVSASGWTFTQDSSDASDDVTFWGYQSTLAAGSETSVTVSHGSAKMVAVTHRVTGAADPATRPPESSTVAVGTGATTNATACTPTGGAKDYLWVNFAAGDGEGLLSFTYPTNYGSNQRAGSTGTGGAVATNCAAAVARRTDLNAASEDPGAGTFLAAVNAGWTAWCVAVHPPGAAATSLITPNFVDRHSLLRR